MTYLTSRGIDHVQARLLKQHGVLIEPIPTIDQMVAEFLRQHDVHVLPPACNRTGDALAGAFFGAAGPAAAFGGAHLRNQEKIAALQEWTSWKQWALSHAEWPDFKHEITRRYEDNKAKMEDLLANPRFIQEYKEAKACSDKSNKETNQKLVLILAIVIPSLLGLAVLPDFLSRFTQSETPAIQREY
ncbi:MULTISPECIES: hypothetical protein [Aphanothece]|uniref:hypothetical protein n=1 Tax=Aphanothece TaxID=1121 RepID=UPI003984949F